MPIIGLSLIMQIACAVHCVRHGRNGLWLMIIIFLSIPGCLAYLIFEVLPGYSGNRHVRLAKTAAVRTLDPQRELRAAREALDLADTVANRTAMGDALAGNGSYRDATAHYRQALARTPGKDRALEIRLATAELESGNAAEARTLLEGLPPSASASETDRSSLLLARALEESGEKERALDLYQDVGRRLPGGEAQCRRAALLLSLGRRSEAREDLTEVEFLTKRLDPGERRKNRDMYDWAARTLAELRGS